jgi:predicted transcriptional regulator
MKNKDISSVIVMNESKTRIGIITERYVVYKIAQEDVTLLLQA